MRAAEIAAPEAGELAAGVEAEAPGVEAPDVDLGKVLVAAGVAGAVHDRVAEPEATADEPAASEAAGVYETGVETGAVVMAAAVADTIHDRAAEPDVPAVDVPEQAEIAAVVESIDVDVPSEEPVVVDADIDMPPVEPLAAGVVAAEVSGVELEEVELPRVDVSAPEVELETEGMVEREEGIGLAGALAAAGAVAAVSQRDAEPEAEVPPLVETRLPEIEITDVSSPTGVEVAATAAALAAATGIPETEAAPQRRQRPPGPRCSTRKARPPRRPAKSPSLRPKSRR